METDPFPCHYMNCHSVQVTDRSHVEICTGVKENRAMPRNSVHGHFIIERSDDCHPKFHAACDDVDVE
jgi:hypothetical protein